VTVVDPNPNVLRHVTRRLKRLDVMAVEADVLKPLPTPGPFASAALSGVIHCLPGPMERKAVAVEHIARVLAPDGVFFGHTILGRSAPHTWLGRRLLATVNKSRTFDNLDDTEAGLRAILERSFRDVDVRTDRVTATFIAKRPIDVTTPGG
jgi:SAM-dependent methyltransferase